MGSIKLNPCDCACNIFKWHHIVFRSHAQKGGPRGNLIFSVISLKLEIVATTESEHTQTIKMLGDCFNYFKK